MHSSSKGRPSIPPSLLAKLLLLAYRDGLSDERAMDAVRFDLRFKIALDRPVAHPVPRARSFASAPGCCCTERSGSSSSSRSRLLKSSA